MSKPVCREVVITGMGVVSPLAVGAEATFEALLRGESGVDRIERFDTSDFAVQIGSEVKDFSVRPYVSDRKRIKLMSREMQWGLAAAKMAADQAQIDGVDPDRRGVVFGMEDLLSEPQDLEAAVRHCTVDGRFRYDRWGAEVERFIAPIVMLRYLPNMTASHISIELDARGPCNTIATGGVSAYVAVSEAAHLVRRGVADVVITGGASSRINPEMWIRNIHLGSSTERDDPRRASRPFDLHRDGMVNGEGAAAFVLESPNHARRRGARVLGRLFAESLGFSSPEKERAPRTAIEHGLRVCRDAAGDAPIGFVDAHGLSETHADRAEAEAIRAVLGEIPVTAAKGNLGNLGGGGAAVELAMAIIALQHGAAPPTLNYETPDPACPIRVVHDAPETVDAGRAVSLCHAITGQSVAILVGGP